VYTGQERREARTRTRGYISRGGCNIYIASAKYQGRGCKSLAERSGQKSERESEVKSELLREEESSDYVHRRLIEASAKTSPGM
jgi:hypothetical protein